jgi:hypothetical protein
MNGGALFLMSQGAADAASAAIRRVIATKIAAIHAAQRLDVIVFSSITRGLYHEKRLEEDSRPRVIC